jgi:hypothetical protein
MGLDLDGVIDGRRLVFFDLIHCVAHGF